MNRAADLAVWGLEAAGIPVEPSPSELGERVWYSTCPVCHAAMLVFEEPGSAVRLGCLAMCSQFAIAEHLDGALADHLDSRWAA